MLTLCVFPIITPQPSLQSYKMHAGKGGVICIGYSIAASATCNMQPHPPLQSYKMHAGRGGVICIGYTIAASTTRNMQPHVVILHITCCTRCYAMTNLLHGAACPSLLPSSTMDQIDLLVSRIPASVFFE